MDTEGNIWQMEPYTGSTVMKKDIPSHVIKRLDMKQNRKQNKQMKFIITKNQIVSLFA